MCNILAHDIRQVSIKYLDNVCNMMVTIILMSIGKLPIEVDMNVVSNDLVFAPDSDCPPPIPPKALDLGDNGILDHNRTSHQNAVPPIPPKGAHTMPLFHTNK